METCGRLHKEMNKIQDLGDKAQAIVSKQLHCRWYHPVNHKAFYIIWSFLNSELRFKRKH